MTINCEQTAKNFCRKNNTPEPSPCLPIDEQESMATFTHSQRRWLVSFTLWPGKFVKPQAELPGWLYDMGRTICFLCSGDTCICQLSSTGAPTVVGHNRAKGHMGYL